MARGKLDTEIAKSLYPSLTTEDGVGVWMDFWETQAGFSALGQILGDIYDKTLAEDERERGVQRSGRRPPREAVSMDELWRVVFPANYSMDPFPEAFRHLLAGRSQRAFAMKLDCHQATLSRFLSGKSKPDTDMMAKIALAAKVAPGYFVEWRAQYLGQLLTQVYTEKPNLGVAALKSLGRARSVPE